MRSLLTVFFLLIGICAFTQTHWNVSDIQPKEEFKISAGSYLVIPPSMIPQYGGNFRHAVKGSIGSSA